MSGIFIAACMVLISASFAAVLYLMLGLPMTAALVCGIAALTGFALCTVVAAILRSRHGSAAQMLDLSRGVADLARQGAELGRRVAAMDNKVASAVEGAEAATVPIVAEIGEIGVLIRELAEQVGAHDVALQALAAPVIPARSAVVSAATPPITPSPPLRPEMPVAGSKPATERRDAARSGEGSKNESVPRAGAGFKGLDAEAAKEALREAVEAGRLEFYLQPVVALPQRKVRHYEALARVRLADGELAAGADFLPAAAAAGLMPQIDNLMLFRCVQVVRRLMGKNRDVGLFCNIAASTLVDPEIFPQFTEFLDANRVIAPLLMFEFTQAACRAFGPSENESLAVLSGYGFRFAMDQVGDLKLEPRELVDRGFRFVKVPAALLLNRHGGSLGDIHAADLTGLLSRFGIELIADKIENEATVVDLLDYDVRYGQGFLFSQPRPLRAEILQASPPRAVPAASAMPAELAVPGVAAVPAAGARTEVAPVAPEPPFRASANAAGVVGAGAAALAAEATVAKPAASREALQRPTVLAQIARTLAVGAALTTGAGEDSGFRSR